MDSPSLGSPHIVRSPEIHNKRASAPGSSPRPATPTDTPTPSSPPSPTTTGQRRAAGPAGPALGVPKGNTQGRGSSARHGTVGRGPADPGATAGGHVIACGARPRHRTPRPGRADPTDRCDRGGQGRVGRGHAARPETWGEPDTATAQVTDRYGTAQAMAWDRLHPRLTTRSAWIDHDRELPIIEGTLICLRVDRLSGGQRPATRHDVGKPSGAPSPSPDATGSDHEEQDSDNSHDIRQRDINPGRVTEDVHRQLDTPPNMVDSHHGAREVCERLPGNPYVSPDLDVHIVRHTGPLALLPRSAIAGRIEPTPWRNGAGRPAAGWGCDRWLNGKLTASPASLWRVRCSSSWV